MRFLFINFIVVLWLTAITTFGLGIFVLIRNHRNIVNRTFAFYSLSIFLWSFSEIWGIACDQKLTALIWTRIEQVGVFFIPSFFIHFVVSLLNIKNRRWLLNIAYFFSFAFALLCFTPYMIADSVPKTVIPYVKRFGTPGIAYHFAIIFFISFIIYGLIKLYEAYIASSGAKRNQLKYLLLSSLFGYVGGGANFLLVYDINIPVLNPFGTYALPIYIAIVTYAIIRYRLLDINIALTRLGIFLIVYTMILGVPFWLGFRILGMGLWILPISIMALLATLGPFLIMYLQKHAEDIIFKDQRKYQRVLNELSKNMTLIKDLDRLLKLVVYRVSRAVKVEFACIYISNVTHAGFIQSYPYKCLGMPKIVSFESQFITELMKKMKPIFVEELDAKAESQLNLKNGLIIPCFVRGRLLGFLVLGPKLQGGIYTKEDTAIFEVLANQAALAIENTEFISESQKTQAQLFAAERMSSMGAMAGGMSHQINNRFHTITLATSDTIDSLNFMDLSLCSQEVKDNFQQFKYALSRIQENAKQGGKIVNDFLNFSQPERLQKEMKSFQILTPLDRAIEMVKIKTTFSDDIIDKQIPNDLPAVEGDFVLLQDVFFNLIDNAIDALDQKKVYLNSKTPEEFSPKLIVTIKNVGQSLFIQIKDNGIGISEEAQKRLFVPFFTTKATSSKGTGMGLFVIQKILIAHQGEIKVESKYGQGTTFNISLPLKQNKEGRNE